MRYRPRFLRWLLLTSVLSTLAAAAGVLWADTLSGLGPTYHLAWIPLATWVCAHLYLGALAWRADSSSYEERGCERVDFAAAELPFLGLLCSLAGFIASVVSHLPLAGDLSPDVLVGAAVSTARGAGAAMVATFVGLAGSQALKLGLRIVDRP